MVVIMAIMAVILQIKLAELAELVEPVELHHQQHAYDPWHDAWHDARHAWYDALTAVKLCEGAELKRCDLLMVNL